MSHRRQRNLIVRSVVIISGGALVAAATAAFAQTPAERGTFPPAKASAPPDSPKPAEPGYLGVLTDDRQDTGKGVRVTEAVAGGPAAKGGLAAGDLITSINGKAVHGNGEMVAAIGSLAPGSEVAFEIERNGEKKQINVTLGKRPPVGERRFEQFGPVTTQTETLPPPSEQPATSNPKPPSTNDATPAGPAVPGPVVTNPKPVEPSLTTPRPNGPLGVPSLGGPRPVPRAGTLELPPRAEAPRKALLGLRTVAVPAEIRQRLRLAGGGGALVVARTTGSPADKAGIPVESVIIEFNGTPVESPQELSRLVNQAGPQAEVEIVYLANGETQRAKVTLDEPSGSAPSPGTPSTPRVATPAPLTPPPPADVSEPPTKLATPQPSNDHGEMEALKRRVQELEQRVRELEQAAKK